MVDYDQIDPNLMHIVRQNKEQSPTLMYQLQIDDIIIEIEHLLRGDDFNEVEEKWVPNPQFRHMNELGIKRLSSVLKTYLNRNDFLTTYEEERIMKKCLLCAQNLANLFVLEGDNYEMKEEEYDLIIWEIIMPNVESAIRRATDSMTLNAHSKMQFVQERRDFTRPSEQEQKEVQSKWKFFGGG